MDVQPYLFFDGKCDEALAFYKSAVGAKPKMLMRFKEAPDQSMRPLRKILRCNRPMAKKKTTAP